MASHTAAADVDPGLLLGGANQCKSRFDGQNNAKKNRHTADLASTVYSASPRRLARKEWRRLGLHRRVGSPGTVIAGGPGPSTSSPGGGEPHAGFREEVEQAVLFLAQLVRPVVPDNLVGRFLHALDRTLTARFEAHWYPDEPARGSGFRSISVVGAVGTGSQRVDPILLKAWAATLANCPNQMLPWSAAARHELGAALRRLHTTFTVWIDPGEVTVRMGEEGSTWPLWKQHVDGGQPGQHRHQHGRGRGQQHPLDQHRVPYQIPDPVTDSDSEREGGFSGAWSSTSESSLDAGRLEELDMMAANAERTDSGRLSITAAAFTPKVSAPIDAPAAAGKHPRQPDEAAAWDGSSGSSVDSLVEAAVYTASGAEAAEAAAVAGELPRGHASRGKSSSEKRPNKYQRRRRGSRKKGAAAVAAGDGSAIPGMVAA